MGQKRVLGFLTLLLVLAAFTRIYNLTQQSMWLDEGYTHQVITRLNPIEAAADDMHPPLYYILLAGWIRLTGDSVLAMRALSMLFSMLSIPALYLLARRAASDGAALSKQSIALVATLLFVLSDPDIFMAQEVRNYALHKLTLILNMLAYLNWVERPARRRLLWWIVSGVGMIYTYYLSALVMAAQGLHALFYLRREQRWQALGGLALSSALFVPWALTGLLKQLASPNPLFMPIPLNGEVWLWLRSEYFGQQWALLILLMLLGAIFIRYDRERSFSVRWVPDGPAFLMLCWTVFPFVLIALVNLFRPFVSPRWPFMITPAIVILTARGMGNLRQPARSLILAALVLYGVTTVDSYRPKPPWDKLAAHVATYAQPGDTVLMEANNGDFSLGYYFEHLLPDDVPFRSLPKWRESTDPATYHVELTSLLADAPTVWLVAWGDDHDIFNQLERYDFQRTWQTTEHFSDVSLNVMRFDKGPATTAAAFSNGMTLVKARFLLDAKRVDLWWSASEALGKDYSVSAFVLNEAGQLIAQHDAYPANNTRPTATWQPGSLVYDPHQMDLPDLIGGRYTVGIKVYTWQDGRIYPIIDGAEWFSVETFEVSE